MQGSIHISIVFNIFTYSLFHQINFYLADNKFNSYFNLLILYMCKSWEKYCLLIKKSYL